MTDWRKNLSDPPKPHSLRDMVLMIIDMAEADAKILDDESEMSGGQLQGSARQEFAEHAGYDLYDMAREIMAAFPDAPKFSRPTTETSDGGAG